MLRLTSDLVDSQAFNGLNKDEIAAVLRVSPAELDGFDEVIAQSHLRLVAALKAAAIKDALAGGNTSILKFMLKNIAGFSDDPELALQRRFENRERLYKEKLENIENLDYGSDTQF